MVSILTFMLLVAFISLSTFANGTSIAFHSHFASSTGRQFQNADRFGGCLRNNLESDNFSETLPAASNIITKPNAAAVGHICYQFTLSVCQEGRTFKVYVNEDSPCCSGVILEEQLFG